ncbi:MAG: hypothetical protein KTR18_10230 [Acidiferrobacterales bacterium]|nr:hypothetical protein [Acidiferrobacterales bacterium]
MVFFLSVVAGFANAQETNSYESKDIGFHSVPTNSVLLKGTGTMVLQSNPDAPHAASGGGEAFFCEGDPEGDYVCTNSFATYGCNEECKCCYYEEAYNPAPRRPGGLTAPFRFIQNSQLQRLLK